MKKEYPELPGWTFSIEEVSLGAYRLRARDVPGRNIDLMGDDPETLFEEAKQVALRMMRES